MGKGYVSGVATDGGVPSSGKLAVVFDRATLLTMGETVTGEDGSYYIEFPMSSPIKVFVVLFRGELTVTYDPDMGMDVYSLGDQTSESEIHDNISPGTVELPPD